MPTSVKRKNENIIDFDERRRYKSLEEQSDSNTERWYLVEIYNKLQEIANSNYKVLSKKIKRRTYYRAGEGKWNVKEKD